MAQYFDQSGGNYTARDGAPETFSQNTGNKEFTLIDSTGRKFVFHNFDATLPALQSERKWGREFLARLPTPFPTLIPMQFGDDRNHVPRVTPAAPHRPYPAAVQTCTE